MPKIAGSFDPSLWFDRTVQVEAATRMRTADLAARHSSLALNLQGAAEGPLGQL